MGMKFTNNASTTLASGILAGATALAVQTGAGALFPVLGAGDYFYCTLSNTSGSIEIVKVTARTGDTFSTIVRAQDGTSALSWNAGDRVELRLVSASLNDFPKLDENNVFTGTNTENLSTTSTAVTQTAGDSSTKIATTAFVNSTALTLANGTTAVTQTAGDSSTKVATTAFVASAASPVSQVRQTVLTGATTSGLPSALSIGTGLAINLSATAVPMVLSAAKGFGSNGAIDQIESIGADATGIVTLPASNLSYISRTLTSAWGSTLAPPQYSYAYNQTAQSCLSLNNISTDDFGNTWTNTSVTFTNTSPMIAGTFMGVFNGTSSYMRTTAVTSLGTGGWTLRGKFKATNTALAATIVNAGNASTFGVLMAIQVTSGKLLLSLSSNGTSADITSATVGNTALVNGTGYDLEITYDPVAGKYFTYLNGVAESNLTVTSSSKICGISNITLGANSAATPAVFLGGDMQGFEFLPYCLHPAGTSFTPSTTLANVTAAGYSSDWFDLNSFTMKSVSAASSSAGVDPTFTSSAKVYVAEAVTGASTVTSVTNYAYKGRYDSGDFSWSVGTLFSKNHNLGYPQTCYDCKALFKITSNGTGFTIGDYIDNIVYGDNAARGMTVYQTGRNSVSLAVSSADIAVISKTLAATVISPVSNLSKIVVKRNF